MSSQWRVCNLYVSLSDLQAQIEHQIPLLEVGYSGTYDFEEPKFGYYHQVGTYYLERRDVPPRI